MHVTKGQKEHIRELLIQGKKIEAIKYIHDNYKLGLKESKRLVELVDQDIRNDEYVYDRSTVVHTGKNIGKLVGKIFLGIGIILLVPAIIVFANNQKLVDSAVLITGTVISNPSQPEIEYNYNGETLVYYSSVTSTPPSYELGEKVEIYVDPEDPSNVLINTFSDRWLLITILGVMGLVFGGIGFLVYKLLRQ